VAIISDRNVKFEGWKSSFYKVPNWISDKQMTQQNVPFERSCYE